MKYLHEKNIVHGNLNPGHICLKYNKEDEVVQIPFEGKLILGTAKSNQNELVQRFMKLNPGADETSLRGAIEEQFSKLVDQE